MIKIHYLKEIAQPEALLKLGSTGQDVMRVQEWLWLFHRVHGTIPECQIDGVFGPQTEAIVRHFQMVRNITPDGQVGKNTWGELVMPMEMAFLSPSTSTGDVREAVVMCARQHLHFHPYEIPQNRGPWVRAYCNGVDGPQWAWCMGFALTVIDQAVSTFGKQLTDFFPNTLSCDVVGHYALQHKRLIRHEDNILPKIQPGDLLMVRKSTYDWVHVMIGIQLQMPLELTIEGNTNDDGHRDGYEVCQRLRNIDTQSLDLVKLM